MRHTIPSFLAQPDSVAAIRMVQHVDLTLVYRRSPGRSRLRHRVWQSDTAKAFSAGGIHQNLIPVRRPHSCQFNSSRPMQDELKTAHHTAFLKFHFCHRKMELKQILSTAKRQVYELSQLVQRADVSGGCTRGGRSSCCHGFPFKLWIDDSAGHCAGKESVAEFED